MILLLLYSIYIPDTLCSCDCKWDLHFRYVAKTERTYVRKWGEIINMKSECVMELVTLH
jgi:hypothetical protein